LWIFASFSDRPAWGKPFPLDSEVSTKALFIRFNKGIFWGMVVASRFTPSGVLREFSGKGNPSIDIGFVQFPFLRT
jgi:hypothetical protein